MALFFVNLGRITIAVFQQTERPDGLTIEEYCYCLNHLFLLLMLALSSALGAIGVKNKVLTAIRMEPIGEFYTKWKAIEAMEAGYVCIFSAGTGSPYFTTDTGSSLRGIEIEADVMLKGTRVDGIYTADPEKDPTATKFDAITYKEVLARGLKVMDLTAICMCQDNNLPIYVFNMDVVGNLKKVMDGEEIGTLVHN